MGVSQYTQLTEALKVYDINQEQANQGLAYFDKILSGLTRSKAGVTAIGELGLKMADLQKMNPHDALLAIADAFSKLKDGTQKSGAAAALFGNTYGVKLIPFLNQGRAGIEQLEAKFKDLGDATEANAAAAENLKVQWQDLKSSAESLTLRISDAFGIPIMLESIAHPLKTMEVLILGFGDLASGVFAKVAEGIRDVVGELDAGLHFMSLPEIPVSGLDKATRYFRSLSEAFGAEAGTIAEGITSSGQKPPAGGGSIMPPTTLSRLKAARTEKEDTTLLRAQAKALEEYTSILAELKGHLDQTDEATRKFHDTMAKLNAIEVQGVNVSKARAIAEQDFATSINATMEAVNQSFQMPAGMPGGFGPAKATPTLTLSQLAALPSASPDTSLSALKALQKETELSAASFGQLAKAFPNLSEAEVAALPAGQKMIDQLAQLEKHGKQAITTLADLRDELIAEGNNLSGNLVQNLEQGIKGAEDELTRMLTGQKFNFVGVLQQMGQGVAHSFVEKGVGSLLGKFGLSTSKPDGTANNPLYVKPVDDSGNPLGGPIGGIVPPFPGTGSSGIFGKLESTLGGLLKGGAGGLLGTLGKIGSIFGGFLADGGPVTPGRAYVVGEKHAEFFVPGVSGSVVPKLQMSGSQRPAVYNLSWNIATPDANSFRKSQGQLISEGYRHMAMVHARNS